MLRRALPQEVKDTMIALVLGLLETDPTCAHGVAAGETAGFAPITYEACQTIIQVRLAEIGG